MEIVSQKEKNFMDSDYSIKKLRPSLPRRESQFYKDVKEIK